ncbi:MAG TPA: isoprenylcysteine carboxylmethyltransferase family protein [Anaerolineae bacterium]|nr:isoprenylcysteine carboxylmethyltransferase family protein [Anaerolineae bacterium]
MKKEFKFGFDHILLTLTSVGQILAAAFTYQSPILSSLRNSGWILLWIAGIFGMLPIFTFKRLGKVQKGKSYVHTNQLVDKGIYSIVRHPQYFAGVLIGIALYLISPSLINLVLGIVNIVQYYNGTFEEEERLIDKFGQQYIEYQKKVPRLNPIRGIIQRIIGH